MEPLCRCDYNLEVFGLVTLMHLYVRFGYVRKTTARLQDLYLHVVWSLPFAQVGALDVFWNRLMRMGYCRQNIGFENRLPLHILDLMMWLVGVWKDLG